MTTATPEVAPPPERFNFAEHLLALNAHRAGKPAFVDEQGAVSYGQLAERTFDTAVYSAVPGPRSVDGTAAVPSPIQTPVDKPIEENLNVPTFIRRQAD